MTAKEQAHKKIEELVIRFTEQYDSYKQQDYNETLTRRDFIDPFFKALGWDIDNEQGYAEAYREVIHEDRVRIGGVSKAPDYSFKLPGGKRLFFVEAKKPAVMVKEEIIPAYQIRRYGWSAKLPISIVTDFQEFAVYDCTKRPNPTDKASTSRIKYLTYKDYLTEFDFLWNTFSKEQVLKGSFDRFVKSDTHKKGTATVDKEFLESLNSWRTMLAKGFAAGNKGCDEEELNFAVQQTIDRIIFLRIAEDRSVEPYGNLKESVKHGNYYKNLFQLFHEADDKYNSGLFDFKSDSFTEQLKIDNRVIKALINELYFPISPYEFAVLPVEILGNAYEQFLGKVIRLTNSGNVKIEEKPEVRKAGGVYYTPEYIVQYIVENSVGKLIQGKTPKEVSKIKIVDPACGSGSFLLGAYDYLLNWHKDFYNRAGLRSKGGKNNPLRPDGNLVTAEKKRILVNNIYGVDIDANAVEVSKLSLLLKCLEGETEASINSQMRLFNDRVLPTLDQNIKCGNSLIDLDFYDGVEFKHGDTVKPFNWRREFSNVFKQGGFDAVIGNPPYVNLVSIPIDQRVYFQTHFKTCKNKSDLYSFFIEKACDLTKSKTGLFGFIIPHTWLTTESFELLRRKLLDEKRIESITEMGFRVFEGVVVSTVILMGSNSNKSIRVQNKDFTKRFTIPGKKWIADNYHIDLNWSPNKEAVYNKLAAGTIQLGSVLQFSRGIKTSDDKRFLTTVKKNKEYKPVFRGRNIKSFFLNWGGEYIWYRPDFMKEKVGSLPHSKDFFEVPEKLITQRVNSSMQLLVAYDEDQNYFLDTTNVSRYETWDKTHSFKYIMAILNSRLINYWYCNKYKMPTIGLYELHTIPFKPIDFKDRNQVVLYNEVISLTDQLIFLKKDENTPSTPAKTALTRNKIEYCEQRINEIVFQLYCLSKEEINVVKNER